MYIAYNILKSTMRNFPKLLRCRYQSVSQTVVVATGAATVVNFTLIDVGPQEWSVVADFAINQNLATAYLTAEQVDSELQVRSEDLWSQNITFMQILIAS